MKIHQSTKYRVNLKMRIFVDEARRVTLSMKHEDSPKKHEDSPTKYEGRRREVYSPRGELVLGELHIADLGLSSEKLPNWFFCNIKTLDNHVTSSV